MDKLEMVLYMLHNALGTEKRRHITGGVFLSVALLFGGLAATAITLKDIPESEADNEFLHKEYDEDEYI